MAEKRFTYIKNATISQYQSIPIQKIGKGKAFHCQGLVDELNKLWNENEQLKEENKLLKDIIMDTLGVSDCQIEEELDRLRGISHEA